MGIGDIGFLQANPVGALTGGAQAGLQFGAGLQALSNQQEDRAILAQSRQSEANQSEQQRMLMSVARDAKTALGISDPIQRNQFLGSRAQRIVSEGGDPSDTLALMDLPFEQQNFELQDAINQVASVEQLFDDGAEQQKLNLRQQEIDQRSKAFQLDQQKEARAAGKLSAGLEKALLTAQDRTVEAQRNSNEFEVLAGDFERIGIEGGAASTFTEFLKGVLGTQDDVSEFKRRFNKVRLSEGLKNLPPGPATDRDVQEAFKGVPKDNASPEQVASFLRGAARLARFEAGFNQFKSDFISDKRTAAGLNKEWRKQVESPVLKRKVSIAEIYETAQNRGVTPEEIKAQLGIN